MISRRKVCESCTLLYVSARGTRLVLTDSLGKYTRVPGATIKAYPGETLTRLTDRISFRKVDIRRVSRILVHAGTNDIANLIDSGRIRHTTPQDLLRLFSILRSMIHRRNSRAVILFSSVLPRLKRFELYKGYATGWTSAWRSGAPSQKGSAYTSLPTGAS